MALNSWTLNVPGLVFAASKVMFAIHNGGARVLKVARVGMLNNQTAAVTGVACLLEIRKYPATATLTTPTAVTPVAHDSANSALSSVTTGHSGTPGGSTGVAIRRVFWSSDEPSISTATSDELECFVPLNVVWDAGYGDADVQKLTLRTGEMFLTFNTTGAAGLVDTWGEFTDEA